MAVNRFEGLGWFLCGVVVAPACYLVNSHGAAEQARLNATRVAIVQAQRDIRSLETEFDTRANMAQLERWNGDVLALGAPSPQQYLANEMALASLDQPASDVQMASLVVPAGAPAAAQAAPAVQAVAAVVPAAAPRQETASTKSVAQQDRELRGLMKKADRKAVAQLGDGLLSASTVGDLQKMAQREKLALR